MWTSKPREPKFISWPELTPTNLAARETNSHLQCEHFSTPHTSRCEGVTSSASQLDQHSPSTDLASKPLSNSSKKSEWCTRWRGAVCGSGRMGLVGGQCLDSWWWGETSTPTGYSPGCAWLCACHRLLGCWGWAARSPRAGAADGGCALQVHAPEWPESPGAAVGWGVKVARAGPAHSERLAPFPRTAP